MYPPPPFRLWFSFLWSFRTVSASRNHPLCYFHALHLCSYVFGLFDTLWGSSQVVVGALCMCVWAISIRCGPLFTRWSSFDALWGSFDMFLSSFDTLWGSWCRALLIRCGALFTYNWALMIRCGDFFLLNRSCDTLLGSFHMFWGSLDTSWGSSLVVELFYTLWGSFYV